MPYHPRKPKTAPTPPKELRCVVYLRVSSKDQAQEGWSLDAQLRALRQYAAYAGLVVERELVEDETAKKPGRREFTQMVDILRKGGATEVVVEKVDRLYRNFKDQVTLGEMIESAGVRVHFVTTKQILHKDSAAHEKFMHDVQLVIAKNYIDNLSQEVKKGMREKARQGYWPSRAPIGYRNVISGHKRVMETDPETAPLITRLFEAYAAGEVSLRSLGAYAALLGIRNSRGGRLGHSAVQWILRNPIYAGTIVWHGEETPGLHAPLVDRDLWNRVQLAMDGRQSNAGGGTAKAEYAYKGLIRCGICGCSATPYMAKKKYVYYACTGAKGCPRIGVREEAVTEAIAKQLEGLRIRPSEIEYLKAALRDSHGRQRAEHDERLAILQKARDAAYARLDRLYMDKINGDVPASTYGRLKPEWEAQLAAAERAIIDLGKASLATWEDGAAILEAVSNCSRTFREANPKYRRAMLQHMVSNSQIRDGKVTLELRPWFKSIFTANLILVTNEGKIDRSEIWPAQQDSNLRPTA